jgi:hypothetical protein
VIKIRTIRVWTGAVLADTDNRLKPKYPASGPGQYLQMRERFGAVHGGWQVYSRRCGMNFLVPASSLGRPVCRYPGRSAAIPFPHSLPTCPLRLDLLFLGCLLLMRTGVALMLWCAVSAGVCASGRAAIAGCEKGDNYVRI